MPEAAPADIARFDPKAGLGWRTGRPGEVFTFQEPYGAWSWYPSNDHPSDEAFYDASIATTAGTVAVFNGQQVGAPITSRGVTTSRWHLDTPAATYLSTLAIGAYHEYTAQTPSGMTLSFWLLKRDKTYLPQLRKEAVRSYEWLVDHAGPYPFSSLGFVVVGGDDAMETQTMITLSRGIFSRPDSVIEHELAHQWFGDSVSPVDWKGLWINEGWAMYMQQWYESDLGLYEYAGGIDQWRPYDNQSRQTAGPPGNYDPAYFGDLNAYLGPAMMLDKIRQRIGDDAFGEFVKAWAADHAGQNVDRDDFTAWANDQTGVDLTSLIDQLARLQRPPHPSDRLSTRRSTWPIEPDPATSSLRSVHQFGRMAGCRNPRSSPSWVRPPRARATWRSTWRWRSGARSSTATPCRSTAAWTSAPPS